MKKINKIILYIYLLFSFCLLFLNLVKPSLAKYGITLFILVSIYFIYKKKINFSKFLNKKNIIIFIILAILMRLSLLLLTYTNLTSDYKTFYDNAANLYGGKLDNTYIALFPYLYSYIFSLGNFFKAFGTNYNMVILFNVLIDLIGAFFCYKTISKISNKKAGIIGLLIWLYNPFNLVYITKCCPVIIVNTMIIICFYIFNLIDIDNIKKNILFSILLGLFLSLANSFRPVMIIFIISIFLYYLYLIIKTKKVNYVISFILIIMTFYCGSYFINKNISNKIGLDIATSSGGWSVYLGSNLESKGMWNLEDSTYFLNYYSEVNSAPLAQQEFLKLGLERYEKNGLSNAKLLAYKSYHLTAPHPFYSYNEFITCISNNLFFLYFLKLYIYLFWFLIVILNVRKSYQMYKYNTFKYLPYQLFCMGLFVATLLVEVHTRYFTPLYIPLILIATFNQKDISD